MALMAPWCATVVDPTGPHANPGRATRIGGFGDLEALRATQYTERYRILGQLLSCLTRHFLLMTPPHAGEEEDLPLFAAFVDGDRFEGRFHNGVHSVDVSDLMRRRVKESLLTFEG